VTDRRANRRTVERSCGCPDGHLASAAAPDASLGFLFYGGIVVLPVIAIYTIGVHWVFRGKVRHA
jgi:cytochrome bd-type quinol oxidase subunit 2